MTTRKLLVKIALSFAAAALLLTFSACYGSSGPTTGPAGDSTITGQLNALRKHSSSYPYDMDITVLESQDVNNLPNPTKDKVN